MHSHVDYCWHKAFLNRVIKTLICFCLVYTPFFANAGAAEKWDLVENHYDDIAKNMSYTAKKVGSAVNDASYKAKVPVSAATLGSSVATLIRGGLATAAVLALIEGVGWIIENGVVYKKDSTISDKPPNAQYYYVFVNDSVFYYSNSLDLVINKYISTDISTHNQKYPFANKKLISYDTPTFAQNFEGELFFEYRTTRKTSTSDSSIVSESNMGNVSRVKNNNYDESKPDVKVPVSDIELGNKIIESPAAPQIIPDVYNPNQPTNTPAREAAKEALDKALPTNDPATGESNPKPNKDTDGDGKPDAYDPTAPDAGSEFRFPPFCEIAPVMCVWYEKYSEDLKKTDVHRGEQKSFWEKVEDWFDWTKDNPDIQEDNEIPEITELDIDQLDTGTFKATPGCPQPVQVPVGLGGSGSISISYEPICAFASKWSFVAPLIGFLSGAMIIVGVGRKGEDGEL